MEPIRIVIISKAKLDRQVSEFPLPSDVHLEFRGGEEAQESCYGAAVVCHWRARRIDPAELARLIAWARQAQPGQCLRTKSFQALRLPAPPPELRRYETVETKLHYRLRKEGSTWIVESGPVRWLTASLLGRELFKDVTEKIRRGANIVIWGPPGSGKRYLALLIHHLLHDADAPFVPIPAYLANSSLARSILAGHERGAFTGAYHSRAGLLSRAKDGTVVFYDAGFLESVTQQLLLRFLDERVIYGVGKCEPLHVPCTVIATSSLSPFYLVRLGKFRRDFCERLAEIVISVPSLHQRREDIPLLASILLEQACQELKFPPKRFTPCAVKALMQDTPTTVSIKSLAWLTRTLVVTYPYEEEISEHHIAALPGYPAQTTAAPTDAVADRWQQSLSDFLSIVRHRTASEVRDSALGIIVQQALIVTRGNVSRAAALLGVCRTVIYRVLSELGIRPTEYRDIDNPAQILGPDHPLLNGGYKLTGPDPATGDDSPSGKRSRSRRRRRKRPEDERKGD